jgi:hypothetical protein
MTLAMRGCGKNIPLPSLLLVHSNKVPYAKSGVIDPDLRVNLAENRNPHDTTLGSRFMVKQLGLGRGGKKKKSTPPKFVVELVHSVIPLHYIV